MNVIPFVKPVFISTQNSDYPFSQFSIVPFILNVTGSLYLFPIGD